MTEVENLICRVLRGDAAQWEMADEPDDIAHFLDRAAYHGVRPLLHARISANGAGGRWPAAIAEACHRAAISRAAHELAHRVELARVLEALAAAGVKPLLLKGAALAYSHYPSPALRPRSDTDLLVPQIRTRRTGETLARLGYTRIDGAAGDLASCQAAWRREDRAGAVHHLDVHWRISNSLVLANTLTYDELDARATPLPPLGAHAHGLAPVHALLVACLHRAGHRNVPIYRDGVACGGDERLIWLYDIHLLVVGMSDAELAEFASLAAAKRLKAVCRDALDRCAAQFRTAIPAQTLELLAHAGPSEPSARYLGGGPMWRMIGDVAALEGWRARARLLREVVFPAGAYMREKYGDATIRWLPLLYARRGIHGLWKLTLHRNPRG